MAVGIADRGYHDCIHVVKDLIIDLPGEILAHPAKVGQESGFGLILVIPVLHELNRDHPRRMHQFLGHRAIKTADDLLSVLFDLFGDLVPLFKFFFEYFDHFMASYPVGA